MMLLWRACLIYVCAHYATVTANVRMGTIRQTKNHKLLFVDGVIDKTGLAYGIFRDTVESTGWGVLDIVAGNGTAKQNDSLVMYAAGYLEGILTAHSVNQFYQNLRQILFEYENDNTISKIKSWLIQQQNWVNAAMNIHQAQTKKDDFLQNLMYTMKQFDGLVDGVNTKFPAIGTLQLYIINSNGDILEIKELSKPSFSSKLYKDDKVAVKDHFSLNKNERCSAFVKVTSGFEDIFIAHNTWVDFRNTLRVYKHYTFNLVDKAMRNKRVSFSSYPGAIVSIDDFYILDNKMVLLETSLEILKKSVEKKITPNSLISWQRIRIANQMARNGNEWGSLISRYNSGTYNSQYMVIDLNKFKPGQNMQNGTLTIVEQMPDLVVYSDQTEVLRHGYWASYNIPFHDAIFTGMGYNASANNNMRSFQLSLRARLFREQIGNVKNVEDAKQLLRSNKGGIVSEIMGQAVCGLCCRGDLIRNYSIPFGCDDSKITTFSMAQQFAAYAINGPSNAENLPTFEWKKYESEGYSIEGLPKRYDFDWQLMQRFFD